MGSSTGAIGLTARCATRRGVARCAVAVSLAVGSHAAVGVAQEGPAAEDAAGGAPWVEIHGFVSQGFILSTKNEYLAKSKRGSFEFAEAAINLTKSVSDELRVGFQLLAHDIGPIGNYSPQFDWFYLDYRFADYLGVRIGRVKMPFGLYNELNDIDVARVPILLPQSIYQVDHREFLFAQTGGELYGDVSLGAAGTLEYRAYGGTLSPDLPLPPPPGITVSDVDIPYLYGGRLFWSTPLEGLLGGVSGQVVRFDSDYDIDPALRPLLEQAMLLPAGLEYPFELKFRVSRWIASLQYAAHDLDVSVEYSRWTGRFYSPAPQLFPPHTVNERYYAMASYRVNAWLTPALYYSRYFVNVDKREGRQQHQHDLALTLRFDLTPHWLLKLEGHLIDGTAGLDNRALNDGAERETLERRWGVFLLKTTAYF